MLPQKSEYWNYRLTDLLAKTLPRNFAYWLGLRVADSFYARNSNDRKCVVSNLKQVFEAAGTRHSTNTLESLARKTFQYFGKYLVDFFRFSKLSKTDLEKLISIEHLEYLEQCHRLGRGVLAITAHLGNWELGGAVMAAMGYPVHAVFRPEKVHRVNNFFLNQRARRGVVPIPLGQAASGIFRALNKGNVVALLADRDFTARDDRIQFLGRPARLPRGPARISLRTGAPVLPAFLLRQVDDTFLFRFHPPLFPEEMKSEQEFREKIRDILEKEIVANPHQWFIFDNFWADSTRPTT